MMRCCDGEVYVRANENRPGVTDGLSTYRFRDLDPEAIDGRSLTDRVSSWVVLCFDCDAVLAVVNGVAREEVFAGL